MDPTSLQTFYETAAEVAGALIGLLFVAVSVAHNQSGDESPARHQIPAGAALIAFTNTLTVSLFGLIDQGQVAIPAAGSGIVGILFVLASLVSRARTDERHGHDLWILGVLSLVFITQVISGLANLGDSVAPGMQHTAAIVIVICFLTGIARSWELIGARRITIVGEVHALLRSASSIAEPGEGPASGQASGSSTNTGIRRSVRSWYSA